MAPLDPSAACELHLSTIAAWVEPIQGPRTDDAAGRIGGNAAGSVPQAGVTRGSTCATIADMRMAAPLLAALGLLTPGAPVHA